MNKELDIIFKVLVGSHAYGTNIEGSDEDFKGVYIQSPESVLEHGYQEQVTINKDEIYFEIKRFVELCCTGNPTMLEVLYSPEDCIIYKHEVFNKLISERDKFLSKSCKYSFGGYAYSQISKAYGLNKKMNWEKSKITRKGILDFCYFYTKDNKVVSVLDWLKKEGYTQEFVGLTSLPHFRYMYNVYYDHIKGMKSDNPKFVEQDGFTFNGIVKNLETSQDISLSEVPEWYKICEGLLYFNKDEYSVHCKHYKEYQDWLANRNTQRYVDTQEHGQQIDGKNLLHCYRLLEMGTEIAINKTIKVRRDNANFLISIRKGKHNLQELLDNALLKREELDKAFDKSTLPDNVDRGYFLKLVTSIRKEFYNTTSL